MNQRGSVYRRHFTNAVRMIGLAALASCGGGDPIGPGGQPSGGATTLVLVSGNFQSAPVGTALVQDFVVRADDASGNPVAGTAVTWSVTAGGGSIAPTTDVTDANGLSQARLTVGPSAGTNTAQALVQGLTPVVFTATGTTGGGPVPAGPVTFRTIDAGSYHTCAISTTELPYCWGFNQDGELGNGATTVSLVPTSVSGGLNFRQISGGKFHSCAVSLAGDGYCWGSNLEKQLALATGIQSNTPVLNGRAVTFATISVGRAHSCGLTLGGSALCWGSNTEGQLGFLTKTTSVDTTGWVRTDGEIFTRIAAGGLHNCALTTAPSANALPVGTALCWGFNDKGQLGTGNTITVAPDTTNPSTRLVLGGLTFDSITAGFKHTCALTGAGAAYCWGDNSFGQLGDGSTIGSLAPIAVSGGQTFAALSAGFYHTCGITTAGAAYCWGRNTPNSVQESVGGQLGDGTTASKSSPAAVSGGLTFQSISAGEVTTCGVTTGGVAYCWGDNEYGQLGTGDDISSQVPVLVAGQP
jgi:alpha-tubulin suppressor-like RCC1 family protein